VKLKKIKNNKYLISALIVLLVGIFAVAAVTFFGCKQTSGSQSDQNSSGYANDYSFYDLNKNKISFSDYAGKILVLNFWATWCPPCQAEIPDFAETYSAYKDKGVQFLGISDDDINSLNNYYNISSINYPTLIDGSIDRIMTSWRIDAIPHTFILNGKGKIIFDQLGQMAKEDLVNAIENALQQQ
jgi:peroxiredoxin